jgi:predicted lipase
VKSLLSKYPTYKVKCTGHSLGAALAQLTAMGLKDNGISVATLYNFGQPRVGDANYASCASSYVPTMRVTHLKDTVPHIPYESWGFVHECREAYESTSTATNPQV